MAISYPPEASDQQDTRLAVGRMNEELNGDSITRDLLVSQTVYAHAVHKLCPPTPTQSVLLSSRPIFVGFTKARNDELRRLSELFINKLP